MDIWNPNEDEFQAEWAELPRDLQKFYAAIIDQVYAQKKQQELRAGLRVIDGGAAPRQED